MRSMALILFAVSTVVCAMILWRVVVESNSTECMVMVGWPWAALFLASFLGSVWMCRRKRGCIDN